MNYDYRRVCSGVGNILIDGRNIGGTEGDVVIAKTSEVMEINYAQLPGVKLPPRNLGRSFFIRLTFLESQMENLAVAMEANLGISPIPGGYKKVIFLGSKSPTPYVKTYSLKIYGYGERGQNRMLVCNKSADGVSGGVYVADMGEINLFPAKDPTKLALTFQIVPDLLKAPSELDGAFIEETWLTQAGGT